MKNISNIIKNIRMKNKLSQYRFGKKLGISGKAISSYETGRSTPSFEVIKKIGEVYDVDMFMYMGSTNSIEQKVSILKNVLSEIETLLGRRNFA